MSRPLADLGPLLSSTSCTQIRATEPYPFPIPILQTCIVLCIYLMSLSVLLPSFVPARLAAPPNPLEQSVCAAQ